MSSEVIAGVDRATSTVQIDPGLSALVAAVITGVVALIGHRVAISKNKTEQSATHVEGFEKLTTSLQDQIDGMKTELRDVRSELATMKTQNDLLSIKNRDLEAEVQTKNEVIRGFTRWIALWEKWFVTLGSQADMSPPPEYTWQMKQYLVEVEKASEEAKQIIETDKDI